MADDRIQFDGKWRPSIWLGGYVLVRYWEEGTGRKLRRHRDIRRTTRHFDAPMLRYDDEASAQRAADKLNEGGNHG